MLRKIKKRIRRMMWPKVLRKMVIAGEAEPRRTSEAKRNIMRIAGENSEAVFSEMDTLKSTIYQSFSASDRVLIKINLNTALPFPASTDLDMVERIVDQLHDLGIHQILIGECSSNPELPTRKTMEKKGIFDRIGNRAEFVCFDEGEWIRVKAPFRYLEDLAVPKMVYEVDKIIYLANVKTHCRADFSLGMKLAVGLMHPLQRFALHQDHLQEKVAELSLAVQPDLIILDGRKPFITGGPDEGMTVEGNTILIGTSLLDVDIAGYSYLLALKKENHVVEQFSENPYEMRQFQVAKEIFTRE